MGGIVCDYCGVRCRDGEMRNEKMSREMLARLLKWKEGEGSFGKLLM